MIRPEMQADAAAELGEHSLQRMPQETSCLLWKLGITNPVSLRKRLRGPAVGSDCLQSEIMLLGMAMGPCQAPVSDPAPARSTGHTWNCLG